MPGYPRTSYPVLPAPAVQSGTHSSDRRQAQLCKDNARSIRQSHLHQNAERVWLPAFAYYYCRQKCSGVISRKATFENQFVGLLRQLVPSPEWLELLKQTILRIWHDELGQVSDVRESVEKRLTQIRAKLARRSVPL